MNQADIDHLTKQVEALSPEEKLYMAAWSFAQMRADKATQPLDLHNLYHTSGMYLSVLAFYVIEQQKQIDNLTEALDTVQRQLANVSQGARNQG